MSYIIESALATFPILTASQTYKKKPTTPEHAPEPENTEIRDWETLAKFLATLTSSAVQVRLLNDRIVLRLHFEKIYRHISAITTVVIDSKHCQIKIISKLLNFENLYLRVEGKERRKFITKTLYNVLYQHTLASIKISLQPTKGTIKIQTRLYNHHDPNDKTVYRNILRIVSNLRQQIRYIYEPLQSIIQISNENHSLFAPYSHNRPKDDRLQSIHHLSKFLNIPINLRSEEVEQERLLNESLKKQWQSMQQLKHNHIELGNALLSVFLYHQVNPALFLKTNLNQFDITFMQRQQLQRNAQMPALQKANNPLQNSFVLNYIRVNKKLSETSLRKINSGGFTSIYLSEIEYWYVGSYTVGVQSNEAPRKQMNDPPHKKYIIIKREDKVSHSGKSRIAHERFILTTIKNGLSMFLPKYYLLAQKDNSYQNDLLVDYIHHPNLNEYMNKNSETLSLQSKIYLLTNVTQALRYLQEYKIVHLDLKPTNIMMQRRLNIKLIDFGQSYHPDLKNHQPGFSMPYSAPENYNLPDTYTYKNDVFSLGIILYEMLLGRYPFYIYSEKLREQCYGRKEVHRYWFNVPEQDSMYGDHAIFPILRHLIEKCLHPVPQSRPELEWIVLVLRDCLDYFY